MCASRSAGYEAAAAAAAADRAAAAALTAAALMSGSGEYAGRSGLTPLGVRRGLFLDGGTGLVALWLPSSECGRFREGGGVSGGEPGWPQPAPGGAGEASGDDAADSSSGMEGAHTMSS